VLEILRRQLAKLQEQRADAETAMAEAMRGAETESRALTADETSAFDKARGDVTRLDGEIAAQEARIADAEQVEARKRAHAGSAGTQTGTQRAAGDGVIGREPTTYDPSGTHSYWLDIARAELGFGDGDGGPQAARDRLSRHAAELRVEMPKREARRYNAAQTELRQIPGLDSRARESAFERRTNPNRTDGTGGYFVPPLWLIDQYIDYPRFGRTIANAVRNFTLPGGTDSINLPKINTGTATGVQTADAQAVTSTDMTDTTVNAPVRTIAGQQDIAIQLLDQSPISFDEVVFTDLMADYNQRLDVQVISGTGSNGQVTGILNVSGINAVTYTDASPTLVEMWPYLLQAVSQVAKNRKMPPQAIFTIPSLWYWAWSQLDGSNRPFLSGAPATAFNPVALQTGADTTEGYVGNWAFGLPHLNDGNIPSNLGAGTNETRVLALRTSDLYLWEGSMRTRALQEVLSGTLQVRLQVFNYVAFMGNRRPEAISVISGTGCIPATGF